MKPSASHRIAAVVLIVLGLYMLYLGLYTGPRVMRPPLVTAVGFFVIAWALLARPGPRG